jgi:predicted DNA-binding transcriptional regulator YafY
MINLQRAEILSRSSSIRRHAVGDFLIQERFVWFDAQVRRETYPNASTLAEHFEISPKTAQRTIEFLRDRMFAPLDYDPSRKGYLYTEKTFDLPRLRATPEELLSVLLARRLLSGSAGGVISDRIRRMTRKLLLDTTRPFELTPEAIDEAFSAAWHGHAPVRARVFQNVSNALLDRRMLRFSYRSPGTNALTEREVEPHHLQYYMANWVLIAFCHNRQGWRKFFLSRMEGLEVLRNSFSRRPKEDWWPLLEESFGIFQGPESVKVTLRFTPFRARWIREQHWHPEQDMTPLPDGGLDLSFPVADFREVKMKILQFGADVKVLAPEDLIREIREEIGRMQGVYGEKRISNKESKK